MALSRFTPGLAMISVLSAAHGHLMYAQGGIDPDRLANLRARLSQVNKLLDALPDAQKKALSSGAQNLQTVAQGWNKIEEGLGKAPSRPRQAQSFLSTAEDPQPDAFVTRVSNSTADFLFSMMGGFTQSETSTAWCGNNVVAGFNDSGSLLESVNFGPGGASF